VLGKIRYVDIDDIAPISDENKEEIRLFVIALSFKDYEGFGEGFRSKLSRLYSQIKADEDKQVYLDLISPAYVKMLAREREISREDNKLERNIRKLDELFGSDER